MNKEEPKNPRLSLHHKYKRRLRSLSWSVAEFLSYAEQKLDPDVGGKIYKRVEIVAIVAKCRELRELLPDQEEALNLPPIREDLLVILRSASDNTDKILAEANDFFKNLSKEEWEEMRKSYEDET